MVQGDKNPFEIAFEFLSIQQFQMVISKNEYKPDWYLYSKTSREILKTPWNN